MKKLSFLVVFFLMTGSALMAQNEKYVKAMQEKIGQIKSAYTPEALLDLANAFARIGDAEKNQWLPYYYAAYSHVMRGYMISNGRQGGFADQTDPEAARAETYLNKALSLTSENAELLIVKKMISSLRMMADPMNRWQTEGPIATEALAKARQLDPQNPRIALLEGQDKFYTPEQFGGSKTEAKLLFEDSIKKFETHKPASALHPTWGLEQAKYFLDLASK